MKPRLTDASSIVRESTRMPKMLPFVLPINGRDITFMQATHLRITSSEMSKDDPAPAHSSHVVMANICAPDKSTLGLFIALSPHAARSMADALNCAADKVEAKILKGTTHES
jgi:hypothetical protein